MTDRQLSLRDVLVDLAEEARPVDLSVAVRHRAKLLHRRRRSVGGLAAVGVLGVSSLLVHQLRDDSQTTTGVGGPGGPATAQPCSVIDNFDAGSSGIAITPAMTARAKAMGEQLCTWVGGGAKYSIEEWVSAGGLSGGFSGLTYDIQAHVKGAAAGPVDDEAWVAVYQGAPASGPFEDGTQVDLQTRLAEKLRAKIEAPGSPFDAFGS